MSADFPHLGKAPIVEAVIDFRVRLPRDFAIDRFKALHSQFQSEYPRIEESKLVQYKLEARQGNQPEASIEDHGLQGYLFRSADDANVVQFRRDGFTFNRLKPYTSWGQVFPEATRFWRLYAEVSKPIEISRIAVRYINRLMLPGPRMDFAEYLAAPPILPGGPTSCLGQIRPGGDASPQRINSFVGRVTASDPGANITAAVVQAIEPPTEEWYIPVILDIDVFQENVANLDANAVLNQFGKLREVKNHMFFGSITNKTFEMLK